MGIPGGARDFAIQSMDTRNKETWDVLGIQLNLFYLCNISYSKVERFSLIRGYRHCWSNHVTKPRTSLCELFFFFFCS